MPTQDLTPQLRTRLSRLEKVVGWFVTIATLLLVAGLAYYIYTLAERKGWFLTKAPYFTYLHSGAGIRPGDSVKLMGFDAGKITQVKPEKPNSTENVYVEFVMYEPNFGYVWNDSWVLVRSAGLLGARFLEVTKGGTRSTNDLHSTYKEEFGKLVQVFSRETGAFKEWKEADGPFELFAEEPPELSSQLDEVVKMAKVSITNILQLTNALNKTLTNAAEATEHLKEVLLAAKPLVTNMTLITEHLKEPRGSLGNWIIPTNMQGPLALLLTNANSTVGNVNSTVTNANTNLVAVFSNVTVSLENLANITSNLNSQVQANTNVVSSLSDLIVHADDMIQGLKRHWLLRSAFKKKEGEKTNTSSRAAEPPRPQSPKGAGRD
ncbi:MAG TPA: MlaD family protein [Candidatus Acidoferrum sp.]|nr:MlaD family protein [Candidatus Acidoferrum sp.]